MLEEFGQPLVVQQLENNILVPQIQGDAVELHPAVVILALTEKGLTSMLSSTMKWGAEASGAIGPIGMGAAAASAGLSADLVIYSRGKGLYAGFSLDGAGKTGTTNDEVDAWFAGYTPSLVAAVWVGADRGGRLGLTGAQAALPIWAQFMRAAEKRQPAEDFVPPPGVVFATIDSDTGFLARADCPAFIGDEPRDREDGARVLGDAERREHLSAAPARGAIAPLGVDAVRPEEKARRAAAMAGGGDAPRGAVIEDEEARHGSAKRRDGLGFRPRVGRTSTVRWSGRVAAASRSITS